MSGKWLTTARPHDAARRRKSCIICKSCIVITSNGCVERPAETGTGGNICRKGNALNWPPPSASTGGRDQGNQVGPPPVGSFPEEDGSTNNDEIKEK